MSHCRCFAMLLVAFIATTVVPGARASRTAEDSRGLPRLLAVDESDVRLFPATVAALSPQLVMEGAWSSSDPLRTDPRQNDEFAMALTGRRLRFGYVLDGSSQNLIVGGPGGWGAVLGFVDRYTRDEDYDFNDEDYMARDDFEDWSRTFRVALGWRRMSTGGRLFDIGVAGSLIQAERDVESIVTRAGETESHSLRWKADAGLGIETSVRTLAAEGGLQAAFRFRYEDLHPDSNHPGFDPKSIRRGATLDLGWRIEVPELDDFVVGVTANWWRDQQTTFTPYSWEPVRESEHIVYGGAIFLSAEERVSKRWVVRGGVQGPAQFVIDEHRSYEKNGQEYIVNDEGRQSSGSTLTPRVYLGAGWTWKKLTLDARLDDRITTYDPFLRWSARLNF